MIAAITASGRKDSNSTAMVKALVEEAGTEAKFFDLSKMDFKGCTGCGACRRSSDSCVLEDDLTELLDFISKVDGVVVSTPNYYGYASGIFKSFLDRWYSFRDGARNLRLPEGRPLVFIMAQGHPDPQAYEKTTASFEKVFTAYGFNPRTVIGNGLEEAGGFVENKALKEIVSEAAKEFSETLKV